MAIVDFHSPLSYLDILLRWNTERVARHEARFTGSEVFLCLQAKGRYSKGINHLHVGLVDVVLVRRELQQLVEKQLCTAKNDIGLRVQERQELQDKQPNGKKGSNRDGIIIHILE